MLLADLLPDLDAIQVDGPTHRAVESVTHDSRVAGPRDIYVALPGLRVDGRQFVPGLNVAAVIAEGPVDALPGVSVVRVASARRALAHAAAALAGHPARHLSVVGVTGTNGKTTTTWMIEAIAAAAGLRAGVIGTTGHRVAGRPVPATHTTPEAPLIQSLLAEMRDAGCALAAMEVSSIGLDQRRADGIPFRVAVFTSFSRDHLDYHQSMERYLAAKWRLFTELLPADGRAILPRDVAALHGLPALSAATWWTSALQPADLWVEGLQQGLAGSAGRVHTPAGAGALNLPLVGLYNVENALGAIGAALALGIGLDTALRGLAQMPQVPGRLERIADAAGRHVFVDYAHTPDALASVLTTLRPLSEGRIVCVFGCGGDRDAGKRPLMGEVASRLSDEVILTSDNPRSEDPLAILDDIAAGLLRPARRIVDRRAAIVAAVQAARKGDVVLIAGKGHETTQTIGDLVLPFDDRVVAADAIGQARA